MISSAFKSHLGLAGIDGRLTDGTTVSYFIRKYDILHSSMDMLDSNMTADFRAGVPNAASAVACALSLLTSLSFAVPARAEPQAQAASAAAPFAFADRQAQNAYTNHAGNVAWGIVVALDARTVTISNETETVKLPLSIFPESERRRIAADFGEPRVPVAVRRAIAGAEKAMARSRKRAEKGLCSKEESDAFCAKSEAALKSYLDKQVKEGVITPAERKALLCAPH